MRHHEKLPRVSVEHVSRSYEPMRIRRIERLFSLLGGIVPGEDMSFQDEEEEDLFEEADEKTERVGKARVVLDDVSFEATGGVCFALVGPPRAGKSVLMRIIAGLAPPTSGHVVVHGRVAAALDSSTKLFPRVGKLRTALPLFAGFHGIPPRIARRHLEEMAKFLGWPDMEQQHVSLLSTKRRRSLMLALALHVEPDIVLIDCVMPRGMVLKIQERMLELKRAGVLLIVAAPNVESVAWIADRAVHMNGGVVVREEQLTPSNAVPEPEAAPNQISDAEFPISGEFSTEADRSAAL